VLHLARKIRGALVLATDGEIGAVEDFFFEEDRWTVRYVHVDTGRWLSGKRVLISPMSVTPPWNRSGVRVTLTRDQVWNSPEVRSDPPSRVSEAELLRYYGYPIYWGAGGVWGAFENPGALVAQSVDPAPLPAAGPAIDVEAQHLRSTNQSTGYHLHARDGEIGHVDDFVIGEESWRIRYLLVDTSNWIGGRSVVVLTDAVTRIEQDRGVLHIDATRDQIRNSDAFESIEAAVGPGETGPPFVII
jgi:uncharacterized protein YrrD